MSKFKEGDFVVLNDNGRKVIYGQLIDAYSGIRQVVKDRWGVLVVFRDPVNRLEAEPYFDLAIVDMEMEDI